MERPRNRQRNRAARSRFRKSDNPLTRVFAARDHDLPWAIEVRRSEHTISTRFVAKIIGRRFVGADYRNHPTRRCRRRFLHELDGPHLAAALTEDLQIADSCQFFPRHHSGRDQ